jgi:HK97 family phage major capsid protein
VDPKDTAAQLNGADTERKRSTDIRALVREYGELAGVDQQRIDGWLDDASITAQAVREALLVDIKAKAATAPKVKATVGAPRADSDPRRGFQSHRDFLFAVIENRGRSPEGVRDERLRPLMQRDKHDDQAGGELAFLLPRAFNPGSIRAAAGSDEQGAYADPYGGFLVPETTLPGLLTTPADPDPTMGRTQPLPMASPTVKINARVDKNHSTSVSGGLVMTRRPETIAATSSRMEFEQISMHATSLMGLAYATEEILTDSPISFAALLASGFQDQFPAHMIKEKIRGVGGSEYLGILNSPALITISEESGQAADTILAENVINMRSRCWNYGNAIWIANHDAYPQLIKMAVVVSQVFGSDTAAAGGLVLVYQPSLREDRPDMLLGRPIFYSEYASTIGDPGDLILGNWSQYLDGLYQPLQSAESVHVRFVEHERAFKFWVRNAGAPWWRSALTPAESTTTLSPFVVIEDRD